MTTYYVATNGTSDAAGTIGDPLNRPPSAPSPGDTIYFRSGTYNFAVDIGRNGSDGSPITYKAYNGESVTLRGGTGAKFIFDCAGRSHIAIEGITFKHFDSVPRTESTWVRVSGNASKIVIRDCVFIRTGNPRTLYSKPREWAINVSTSDDVEIDGCTIRGLRFGIQLKDVCTNTHVHDCTISDTVQSCIVVGPQRSIATRGCLIENNVLEGSWMEDGIQFLQNFYAADPSTDTSSRCAVIRNNVIRNNAENAVDFKGARYITVEGNTIYGTIGSNNGGWGAWNYNSMGALNRGTGNDSHDIIVRNNILYDNCPGVWMDDDNFKAYNNVIIYNNRDYRGHDRYADGYGLRNRYTGHSGCGWKNNIIGGHRRAEVAPRIPGNNFDIDYNLYFKGGGGSGKFSHDGTAFGSLRTFAQWKSYLSGVGGVSGNEANSLYFSDLSSVRFVDVPEKPTGNHAQYDFKLRSSSPAYQAGGPLTHTNGSGSVTTSVPVDDATWFMDGYDSSLYSGDTITIGSTTVTITGISGDTLTVSPAVTFSDNAPVYWGDSATPHMGVISTVTSAIVSDFEVNPAAGAAPLALAITDRSFGASNYSYLIAEEGGDFVEFSTSPSPAYVLDEPGTYTIKQVVDDGAGDEDESTIQVIATEESTPGDTGGTDNNAAPCSGTVASNGTFDADTTGWSYTGDEIVVANAEAICYHNGDGVATLQQTLTLESGATYLISFQMRSSDVPSAYLSIDELERTIELKTEMTTYSYQFVATSTSESLAFLFEDIGTVHLDNICVKKISGVLEGENSVANVPVNLLTNGDFSDATWDTAWDYSGSSGDVSVVSGELVVDNDGAYYISQDVAWDDGNRYALIYHVRHDANGSRNIYVSARDSGGSEYGLDEIDAIPPGGSMTRRTHAFTPDGDDASGYLRWFINSTTELVYDDIALYAKSAYAAFSASWGDDTIAFTDASITHEGSLTYSWEYQIDGGGYTQFSTAQNPSMNIDTAGTYDFRLTIDNGQDADIVTMTGVTFESLGSFDPIRRGLRRGVKRGLG